MIDVEWIAPPVEEVAQQPPQWMSEIELCHIVANDEPQTFCGLDCGDGNGGGLTPCGYYEGQAICPGCGRPTCPRCAQLASLADRLV
jgi:hypothetical protein